VDLTAGLLRLPDSNSGAKTVHLGGAALNVLRDMKRPPCNPHVIADTLPGRPLSDLQPFWRRARARAGLKDVRINDLRHTVASVAVAAGQRLPMIGKLLGHTQVQTTARYAHRAGDPVQAAANDVASIISVSMARGEPEPIRLRLSCRHSATLRP
jgi:integrase